jgi:hypothetical protein
MATTERKRLPIAEIEALYPEQFILIDEPEVDEGSRLVSGIVVFTHRERNEVYRRADELKLRNIAVRCTRTDLKRQKYLL